MDPFRNELPPPFSFGPWQVDPATHSLSREDRSVRVEPRIMALLCLLASEPGTPWGRAELMARLWPDTHVGEDALTRAVSELRKVLGDEPRNPTYIATIPKRGYQFLGEVRPVLEPAAAPSAILEETQDRAAESAPRETGSSPVAAPSQGEASFLSRRSLGVAALVLLPFLGWLFQLISSPTPPAPVAISTTPAKDVFLTNYPGRERQPALSPDGSRVAFVREQAGHRHIFMIDAHGNGERALTTAAADHDDPAWSPDGTRLAFTRSHPNGVHLLTASALGGDETLVYEGAAMDGLDFGPNGRRLYFAERTADGGPFRIQCLNLANHEVTPITSAPVQGRGDILPRVSPDGTRLAFMRVLASGAWQLLLVDPEGKQTQTVVRRDLHVAGFDWVDNRYVIISNLREGAYGLWLIDVTNGQETWLPTRGERSYAPTYAAAAHALVYEKVTFEKNIWVLDTASPADSHRPLIDSNYYDCEAVFSPDGTRLLFTSSRSGSLALWLAENDGADLRQLTDLHGMHVTRPRWSPDGTRAAVSSLKDGEMQVYLVEPATGRVRHSGMKGMLCDWGRSGDALYVAGLENGRSTLFHWDLALQKATPFLEGDVFYGRESDDARWFYFTYRGRDGLWRKPLVGEGEATLVVADLAHRQGDNWDLARERLYYVAWDGNHSIAVSTALDGSDRRELGPLPRIASPSLSVSRDGTRLLYGRVMRFEVDLILTQKPWGGF
ncbi:LpqB family beta-propeller domain-containing protein [Acanthopleuribacter pedis]|uniref:PD40 domain-containing protein n=1 Tax=Acanthopleuribacter pedis TaxID=442870 RepID=A0A8J7QEW3_9BACT|nr:LpqB family beta-propeller domain-containing protein [Acanthopleuribacter pedis]MBO1318500.1 PD40 domain-containing protein [Acanthopleuribacter pedis]